MTNTELLRSKIDASGYKIKYIAEQIGITYQCLLNKINNRSDFSAPEIMGLCALLGIDDLAERESIFFAE